MKKIICLTAAVTAAILLFTACSAFEIQPQEASGEEQSTGNVTTTVVGEEQDTEQTGQDTSNTQEVQEDKTPQESQGVYEEEKAESGQQSGEEEKQGETEGEGETARASIPVEAKNYITDQVKAITDASNSADTTVSDYIVKTITDMGLTANADQNGNIIVTRGENPKVILHSSMDIKKGDTFAADETKLSSKTAGNLKNALGAATALYILKSYNSEKPIKVIFTQTNADGTSSAGAVPAEELSSPYLIDLNYYSAAGFCDSGSGKTYAQLDLASEKAPATLDTGIKINISGLLGGYSYNSINTGRANAIKMCAQILRYLSAEGMVFELAEINGGESKDTLASACSAVIVTDSETAEAFETAFNSAVEFAYGPYKNVETSASITFEKTDAFENVFTEEAKNDIISALCLIKSGVNTMSQSGYGIVESSVNISMVKCEGDAAALGVCVESEKASLTKQLLSELRIISQTYGMQITLEDQYLPWEEKQESGLTDTACAVYEKLTGEKAWITSAREYTPCQTFYTAEPKLDMIRAGYQIESEDGKTETLNIEYMPITLCLVTGILDVLA